MTLFLEYNLDKSSPDKSIRLLDEKVYSITVNGRSLISVHILPEFIEEFVVGYLISEGILKYSEIESIMLDGSTIGVLTVNPLKVILPKKSVVSGCGGTASYLDPTKLPKATELDNTSINTINTLSNINPNFPEEILAYGGFSAMAFTQDGIITCASDLSQLVAFDKVIGFLLKNGYNLSHIGVVCSGKITADLVRKALYAQIAVIASCMPPTTLAVATAKAGNITLIQIPKKIFYNKQNRINTQ